MIEVENLTKSYGPVRAIDRLTFAVGRGEVVGLLGPNGAGKTTTMRVLSTFLPPTAGRARVAGRDLLAEPLAVRAQLGYLPENVPLYPEMRVREFLDYRARLKDVPGGQRRGAIARVVDACRLGEVENRILGQLSRGYRQRVGLADALLHQPAVLILDEPTAGLDPIQIREVRELIRGLGDRHTVLLSTHILQEVEAVCGRVILIARGRIVIDDRLDALRSEVAIIVEAAAPAEPLRRLLETTEGVARVRARSDGSFEVQVQQSTDPRERLARRIVQQGWGLRRLDWRRSTLEERFVAAVGQAETATDAAAGTRTEDEAA